MGRRHISFRQHHRCRSPLNIDPRREKTLTYDSTISFPVPATNNEPVIGNDDAEKLICAFIYRLITVAICVKIYVHFASYSGRGYRRKNLARMYM